MKSKSSTIRLLYADSESSADLLYLSGVFVPDPFLVIIAQKKSYAVVSQLEFGRVAKKSKFDEVMLLETIRQKAADNLQISLAEVGPGELMVYFAQRFAVKKIEVPADFPALYYARLFEAGYRIEVVEGGLFSETREEDRCRGARHPPGQCCLRRGYPCGRGRLARCYDRR